MRLPNIVFANIFKGLKAMSGALQNKIIKKIKSVDGAEMNVQANVQHLRRCRSCFLICQNGTHGETNHLDTRGFRLTRRNVFIVRLQKRRGRFTKRTVDGFSSSPSFDFLDGSPAPGHKWVTCAWVAAARGEGR